MQDEPIFSWKVTGLLVGLILIVATAMVKPLGVSTQLFFTDSFVLHSTAPAVAESNEYLSKYGEKQDWGIGYGWMLVLGMFVGGSLSSRITHRFRTRNNPSVPSMWQSEFGSSSPRRRMHAFTGGLLLLFGSRLAGGCTSGHVISGISQLTIGSFIFGISIFASGIVTAKILYRKGLSS